MSSIILVMVVVAIGLALGLLRGGRIDALFSVRPRWWGLLTAGVVLQAIGEAFDLAGARSLVIIGMFCMIVALVANGPTIAGAFITAFGIAMNLVVLVANGSVPVRFEALIEAGIIEAGTERSRVTSVGHLLELETSTTRFAVLGDVIPVGLLSSVISIGDLVTFAGLIVMVSGIVASPRSVGLDVDELFAAALPPVDLEEVLDLEAAPIGDDSLVILPADTPIDLTAGSYDPDDLWADESDDAVRILGPSTRST